MELEIRERDIVGLSIVKKSPFKRPQFYTYYEGGDWIDWPDDAEFDYEWLRMRASKAVAMGGLLVHSLSFGHPLAGYHKIQRWDCVNGFDNFVFKPHW